MIRPQGVLFVLKNWKLIVHLLLGTSRFGVNNQWTSSFGSILARREPLTLESVIQRYRLAKIRATDLGFLHPETCYQLGWMSKVKRDSFRASREDNPARGVLG